MAVPCAPVLVAPNLQVSRCILKDWNTAVRLSPSAVRIRPAPGLIPAAYTRLSWLLAAQLLSRTHKLSSSYFSLISQVILTFLTLQQHLSFGSRGGAPGRCNTAQHPGLFVSNSKRLSTKVARCMCIVLALRGSPYNTLIPFFQPHHPPSASFRLVRHRVRFVTPLSLLPSPRPHPLLLVLAISLPTSPHSSPPLFPPYSTAFTSSSRYSALNDFITLRPCSTRVPETEPLTDSGFS
ncbi:hypothetical protein R3P38DRAFT_3173742 [Favolaschia claudopus]|uniref:Uncharacterized protein n=1 Tax=Favolaschia claudopus TaxID=2862362 RepID=A0AAW0DGF2_9AGAR